MSIFGSSTESSTDSVFATALSCALQMVKGSNVRFALHRSRQGGRVCGLMKEVLASTGFLEGQQDCGSPFHDKELSLSNGHGLTVILDSKQSQ